jgi:hypothetical protein
MREIVKRLAVKTGFSVVKTTPKAHVTSLIEKLHPYKIDKDLIRLGPPGDGGYLIPDELKGIAACFSPGVADISDFEQDCIHLGMKVFMADNSVDKPNLNTLPDNYNFIKKHIGAVNTADFITMDSWVNSFSLKQEEDLLLQMDIEGAEYQALLSMSDSQLKRFRILVIEFHSLECFWNPHFFRMAEMTFDKILQNHSCVHIHPNNCSPIDSNFGIKIPETAEFTFLRHDRATFERGELQFPNKLDFDNTSKKHIALPRNWYR